MPGTKRKYANDYKCLSKFLSAKQRAEKERPQSFFERSPFRPIASKRPTAYGEFPQADVANTYIPELNQVNKSIPTLQFGF